MKKFLALLLAAVLTLSLFTACNSTSDDTNDPNVNASAPSKDNPSAGSEENTETPDTPSVSLSELTKLPAGEYYDEQLVIATAKGPTSLDPYTRGGDFGVAIFTFEKLGQTDANGKLKLQMLKSIEQVDELTYACELWDFITDTDGHNITAKDVEWSMKTFLDAGNAGGVSKFDHIEVTGDYTFNWVNKAPFELGEYEKQIGNPKILAQAAYEGDPDKMASKPVGTGPYKLVEFVEGSYGVYEINEDYWFNKIDDEEWLAENDDVWSYQNFKSIRCDIIPDAAARAIALETGTIDACTAMNSADVNNYAGKDDFTAINLPNTPPVAFYFNLSEESVCSDINLRKALCYAINNAGVAAGLDVPAVEAFGIQPRMLDAPENWLTGEGRDYYTYNVDKAKEYLAKSNYNNEPIVVMYVDSGPRQAAWVLIQAMCNDIGINLKLKMVENSVMRSECYNWSEWDIISDVFGGGDYLPNTLKKWWSEDVRKQLNGLNVCGVEDAELDSLYVDLRDKHDEASIAAWDKYFTDENCIGYAIFCYNDQTACASKYVPMTLSAQLCPGAFKIAE